MRAGYLIAPQRIELREADVPQAQAGGVVVKVRVALTDGTDLKAYRRGHPQMPMPTRFGHEFSGDVAAVGAGAPGFAVGDAIACVHSAPCGACYWCRRGEHELCEHVMETKILGAYAEYVALPRHIVEQNAFRKPPEMSYEVAAFLEPLSCVVHSLDVLDAPLGSTLGIVGDGGFGLLHALAARRRGLVPIVVGRRSERLAVAERLGLATIDAREADVVVALRAHSEGRGVDALVESTGSPAVWEAAPSYVRRGGRVVLFGGLPAGTRVSFDAARLHYDEVRLISPFHFGPRAVRSAFELLRGGAVDVAALISERYPLERLDEAFRALDAGRGLKYAIVP